MLTAFHIEITRLALREHFSSNALETIIAGNIHQDNLRGLIGHDEYHFDGNAFERANTYLEEQRALTVSSLLAHAAPAAWSAFGRLTHAAQDFYAHSNYIAMWLACQPVGAAPAASEVEPMDPELITAGALRSGKVYWLEALTLIQPLRPLIMPLLPRDSHGWMNLDSPQRGHNFKYAFQAAVKRTTIEFERITRALPQDLLALFVDQ